MSTITPKVDQDLREVLAILDKQARDKRQDQDWIEILKEEFKNAR